MRTYKIKFKVTHKNRIFEDMPEQVEFVHDTPDSARYFFWTHLEDLMQTIKLELYSLDCIFITSVSSQPIT